VHAILHAIMQVITHTIMRVIPNAIMHVVMHAIVYVIMHAIMHTIVNVIMHAIMHATMGLGCWGEPLTKVGGELCCCACKDSGRAADSGQAWWVR
jgi:hypothetical protein